MKTMELTLTTALNYIFLPPVLFLIYFGSICCLLYSPNTENLVVPISEKQPQEINNHHQQTAMIIEQLSKRQSRKIASPLGIKQKVQGKDKSLALLKTEIFDKFKVTPDLVITVIQEHLPELLMSIAVN
jgi:hypothetical protein